MTKDLDYYMALPYEVVVSKHYDDGEYWLAKIPLLWGCITYADSWEALQFMIEDAKRLWLTTALEDGLPIPEPVSAG